ncbi:MAG: DUF6515 family protein [Steroidobacteraceae bacterium]
MSERGNKGWVAAGIGAVLLVLGAGVASADGVLNQVQRNRAAAGRPPVQTLPQGYRSYRYGGQPYYFGGGHWYAPGYGGYAWVAPPLGLTVDVLPVGYTTLWIGGVPYYYYDDVYYNYRPSVGYVVVDRPAGADAVTSRSGSDDVYVYPKNGQSEAQQSTDRYECHRWAKGQTNFDPTEPAGGVAASETAARRGEYQRALTACLEGRGYSVR